MSQLRKKYGGAAVAQAEADVKDQAAAKGGKNVQQNTVATAQPPALSGGETTDGDEEERRTAMADSSAGGGADAGDDAQSMGSQRILVFVMFKAEAKTLTKNLKEKGYNAEALHGDMSQNQRNWVIKHFRKPDNDHPCVQVGDFGRSPIILSKTTKTRKHTPKLRALL